MYDELRNEFLAHNDLEFPDEVEFENLFQMIIDYLEIQGLLKDVNI